MTLSEIRTQLRQALGSTRDPELTETNLDVVMAMIPTLLREAREEEREAIATRLTELGNGRMEYVVRPGDQEPQNSTEIDMLEPRGMAQVIYGEATGARNLARIIRGEIDDRGWLPSWRWT